MPVLKAEFLHHHYRGRLRPRHAYAFGLIDQGARAAGLAPGLVNLASRTRAFKAAAGIAPQREVPRFASESLQAWFRRRGGTRNPRGQRVLLFPDTFSNRFHTHVGRAAVEALEAAGFAVEMPQGHVCCGRPLYDYGFLTLARRYLRRTLARLRPWLEQGVPVVGLEPSCVAVFRDELPKLMPHAAHPKVRHLAELLREREVDPPRLERRGLLWGHCHQKATGGTGADEELLRRMGVELEQPQAGCCGLAGSWGFERDHYDVSMRCGEHGLFPAVRELPADALVVANGFSCSTQIQHGTGRRALHLAEVLRLAYAES
jgi:Fe-S oxidoreductase